MWNTSREYISGVWCRRGEPGASMHPSTLNSCPFKLIDLILRVVLEPDDVVLNTPPTFGMYSFDCLVNGAYFLSGILHLLM
jgi:hypothetical protein